MVILRTRNKITDFLMILAWASPFKLIILNLILISTVIQLKCIHIAGCVIDEDTNLNIIVLYEFDSTFESTSNKVIGNHYVIDLYIYMIDFVLCFIFCMKQMSINTGIGTH